MQPSDKQLLSYEQSTSRINIWQGAVRSGKTFASILKLIKLIRQGPAGDVMIVGVTRDAIQRNVISELCNLIGVGMPGSKTGDMRIFGRQVYFVGAHDESAVRRIQGSTLAVAYVDEIAAIPKPFVLMLLSRLSVQGAQLLATCNPEGPNHWLKKEFIDNPTGMDVKTWQFGLDDNPSLSETFKNELKKEYTGTWYKRYILGEWAVAQGLVYDCLDETNLFDEAKDTPNYWVAGLDYGTTNPTCCLLGAISPTRWPQIRIEDEYYYDSSVSGRGKTDAELADDIKAFIAWRPIRALYIDPAAASLKLELARHDIPVADAKNDVIPGIRIVTKFLSQKNLVIQKKCAHLIDEMQTYSWDPKAADRGIDKPVKLGDHACLVAGTTIATNVGYKTIEQLKIGDFVVTRDGYRRVTAIMAREVNDVVVRDIGTDRLTGTKDHPIKTNSESIALNDMVGRVTIWRIIGGRLCNHSTGKTTSLTDKVITNAGNASKANSNCTDYTKKFGEKRLVKSQKVGWCTISTVTKLIMSLATCVVSAQAHIQTYIMHILKKLLRYLRSGIDQKKAVGGTANMASARGKEELPKNAYVSCAESNISPGNQPEQDSAVIIVRQPGVEEPDWIMKSEFVLCAAVNSKEIDIRKQDSVRKNVVYNIEIEENHEYFANNILTSNCDALRYLCASTFPTGEFGNPSEELSISQLRRLVYDESTPLFETGATYY